jgi:threonine/homoserine/homoserine lactone efflux protein
MEYIKSMLLGISLAAIPGPTFFELIRRTLTKGTWSGILLSFGDFLAIVSILMLTFLGISQFLLLPAWKEILFLFGSLILFWIGIGGVGLKAERLLNNADSRITMNNSIVVGFILSIASPLAIIVWITIGSVYLAQYTSQFNALINMLFIAFGIILFFIVLAFITHSTRSEISTQYLVWLSNGFGFILVGYGFFFLYKFARIVFNSN